MRTSLLSSALVISLGFGITLPGTAEAAAPQQRTQAPGWYRIMVGDIEVTALNDGTVELPVAQLLHGPADTIAAGLKNHFESSPLATSDNAWLINDGSRLVLVDAGAGSVFGPTLGKLTAQLRSAGYTPEQVDDILVTHLHPDHVGGLTQNGQRVFPNATVHVAQADKDFWLSEKREAGAPEDSKVFFQADQAALAPYLKAGKISTFTVDGQLLPGISAKATGGHTVGHTAYVVESKGEKLTILGDMIHVAAVQLEAPEITIGFDTDEAQAKAIRAEVFGEVADSESLVAASHFSFPGLGHLRRNGKGWTWVPLDYRSEVR